MIVIGDAVVEWVAKRTNEYGNFGCAVGIGMERDGKLIAGVAYNEFNRVNINIHVAALPRVMWMKPEFVWMCFDYPFNQAKVNRITALIGEGNKSAVKFNEHLGFELETNLKGAHPSGDLLVYVMWREKCRFLREPNETSRPNLLRAAA